MCLSSLAPQSLPWSFKLLYGLLSDCQPLFKQRRKPYFVIGWSVYVLANVTLAFIGTPGIAWLIIMVSSVRFGAGVRMGVRRRRTRRRRRRRRRGDEEGGWVLWCWW
jgi:hypothetical protein